MSDTSAKTFDCVQNMRAARDKLSAETAEMDYDDFVEWLRAHRYADPVLERLAERAAQRDPRCLNSRLR